MALLGVLAQSKKIVGPAQVFLVLYPSGGYTGASDALKVTNLKSLFFSDSATDACRVLIPSQWADLDATGVEIKMKSNPVEFDPNNGSKYTMAYGPAECDVSWTFHDADANHFIDMWSALTGDTFTTAPGASIGGRTSVLLGRQSVPIQVAIMIRYPIGIISPGGVSEYGYIILPNCTINPELQLKVDKKAAATCKVNPKVINEQTLQGSQPVAPFALISEVTAAATS